MENAQQTAAWDQMNLETSKIAWRELQRFFAAGVVITVAPDLDLVAVACRFAADDSPQVGAWLQDGRIGHVADRQAADWLAGDVQVWAVVVKPWILVQQVAAQDYGHGASAGPD